MHSARNRIRRRNANSAAHDDHRAVELPDLRRMAKRPDEVAQAIPHLHGRELHRRSANDLEHDEDAPRLAVEIRDRQRDALPLLIDAQDDELPRLRLLRDARRIDLHGVDIRGKLFLLQNLVHGSSSCRNNCPGVPCCSYFILYYCMGCTLRSRENPLQICFEIRLDRHDVEALPTLLDERHDAPCERDAPIERRREIARKNDLVLPLPIALRPL